MNGSLRLQCKFHAVWERPAPVSIVRSRTSHVTPRLGNSNTRPQREGEEERERERQREREKEREKERERKRKKEKERERKEERKKGRKEERKKGRKEERKKGREEERKKGRKEERKRERGRERERKRGSEKERKRWFGEHLLHPTSSRPSRSFPLCLESGCAAMECHGDRLPGRYFKYGGQGHDVSYDEAREGASRDGRRLADSGMPGDGVPLQENAGYEEDTDDVFPRQAVESDALLSLSASRERLVTWSSRCA